MCRGKKAARPISRAVVALAAVIGSLVVNPTGAGAAAEPQNVATRLIWNRSPAAASCIGEAALARAVERRVGRPVFVPAAGASLVIDGFAERDQARGAWRATLSLSVAGGAVLGRRALSIAAPGCGPLGDMVVLTIALMIRDREASAADRHIHKNA